MGENLVLLVKTLCEQPKETEWLEFKHNNFDPRMVAENISALANSAVVHNRSHAYMVWGVDDATHEIIGTTVRLQQEKRGNQEFENWLRDLLSENADFEFLAEEIEGKHIEILKISKAIQFPVSYEKAPYIRVGSYTRKLADFPAIQARLRSILRNEKFEEMFAMVDLSINEVMRYLNCDAYFEKQVIPVPTDPEKYAHYLTTEGVIVRQDNGLYAITNLGAILFAKKLSDFPNVARKAIRIVQYEGDTKFTLLKEETEEEGYAVSLENAVKYVSTLLPSKEDVNSVFRTYWTAIPTSVIREAIANSIVHQDFSIKGAGPVVELFDNRIEVTNPGAPLVDVMRIIDTPPQSRNEKMASLMRRLKMCEELGRGWDRMVLDCEQQQLPAPRIQLYPESTRVSLFTHIDFVNIPIEDRIWSTYLHACIKYQAGDALTNSSLRKRFGVTDHNSVTISRLIKISVKEKFIKAVDPGTAPRYMKYIPMWA